jgi:hypothetical protein
MAFAGPSLAVAVRHRRWPLRRERIAVVAAVLLGMLMAFAIDRAVSARLEPLVNRRLADTGLVSAEQKARAQEMERSLLGRATNLLFLLGSYFLLGGGLALRGYFSEAQIAPHFLFNTLATLRALIRRDAERAEATLDALVDHLRACMPQLSSEGGLAMSTLGRELDACRSYLELMRLRLGDRLSYTVDAAGAQADRPLLPLLLLTLVENAVKHGVEPASRPVRIEVQVQERADALLLAVEDTGAGRQPGLGAGVGLANLRSQLRDRYGGRAGLAIASRAEGRGVRAELRLPLQEEEALA